MPNYSCHIPEGETAIIDKAIAESPEKERSPWIKECMRQRLEREGYLPGTPAFDVRAEAASAAEFAGADKVLAALRALKADHYSAATPAA